MKTICKTWFALTILAAITSHADTITWTNTAGGSFQEALNWSPNVVPGTNDTALFDLTNAPYKVTWAGNVTNHTQIIRDGTVTFDLGGYTYSLNQESSNTIGKVDNTTLVTYTNGTVQRFSPKWLGGTYQFRLYGNGTTLYLRNAKHMNLALYHWAYADTRIVVDGPEARFQGFGYSNRSAGHVIVTNGGFYSVDGSVKLTSTGSMHISGAGYRALFSINNAGMPAGASILMDNGAVVNHGYYPAKNKANDIAGTITLDDARWYDNYTALNQGWISLNGSTALLQGLGSVEMQRVIMNGGTIRPGRTNQVGLLSFTGHITNAVPTSVLDMELGGSTTNDYDQIRLVAGTRGSGTLYAGGILKVTAINDYEPQKTTTFELIEAVEIVPEFDSIVLPDWVGMWDTSALYTAGSITFLPRSATVIMFR